MLDNLILEHTAELISDPVVACDDHDRIIYTNAAHARVTGWKTEELKGRNSKLVYNLPYSGNREGSISDNGVLYKKDGTKISLNFTFSSVRHPAMRDLVIGKVAVFHCSSQENRSGNQPDDFVSTVSHELRTPLTCIKGFAETLLQSGHRLEDSQKQRFLNIIKEQADQVSRLVEDLLLVSRLDNHIVHLVNRTLNFKQHLDKVCEMMSGLAGNRVFVYSLAADLPPVIADSSRLEQILSNLLSNAIKYSPDGTTILIAASQDTEREGKIKISVIDHGSGIPPDHQETIFNRFSRLDNPLTRKIPGTGLGLYITRSLVQALGGEIWLESSDSTKTEFCFTLPIAPTS